MIISLKININLLISYSDVTIVDVVSDPSVLSGTAAAYLQIYVPYIKSFARHCTQIYLSRDLIWMDEKCTPNKST